MMDVWMDRKKLILQKQEEKNKECGVPQIMRCAHHLVPHLGETFEEKLQIMLCFTYWHCVVFFNFARI
jgi:hypothetical protein